MTSAPAASEQAGSIDIVPFGGWTKNLRLRNASVELVVTLEVGPRILSFAAPGAPNPFKLYPDQAGGTGETVWRNRGGHRLWIAPEERATTYYPDNAPVAWERLPGGLGVRVTPPAESIGFQKQIDIQLDAASARATIVHRITRTGGTPATLALWALSVMTPGGVALMPQPALGQHPRDLLPNRKMIVWPYTDLGDPRWTFGPRFFRLRQDTSRGPTKIGLADPVGWCAYAVNGAVFVKRYPWDAGAPYPDGGCNFETFTNDKMLEIESLGPLVTLAPGESATHTEHWEIHAAPGVDFAGASEEAISRFFDSVGLISHAE